MYGLLLTEQYPCHVWPIAQYLCVPKLLSPVFRENELFDHRYGCLCEATAEIRILVCVSSVLQWAEFKYDVDPSIQ